MAAEANSRAVAEPLLCRTPPLHSADASAAPPSEPPLEPRSEPRCESRDLAASFEACDAPNLRSTNEADTEADSEASPWRPTPLPRPRLRVWLGAWLPALTGRDPCDEPRTGPRPDEFAERAADRAGDGAPLPGPLPRGPSSSSPSPYAAPSPHAPRFARSGSSDDHRCCESYALNPSAAEPRAEPKDEPRAEPPPLSARRRFGDWEAWGISARGSAEDRSSDEDRRSSAEDLIGDAGRARRFEATLEAPFDAGPNPLTSLSKELRCSAAEAAAAVWPTPGPANPAAPSERASRDRDRGDCRDERVEGAGAANSADRSSAWPFNSWPDGAADLGPSGATHAAGDAAPELPPPLRGPPL